MNKSKIFDWVLRVPHEGRLFLGRAAELEDYHLAEFSGGSWMGGESHHIAFLEFRVTPRVGGRFPRSRRPVIADSLERFLKEQEGFKLLESGSSYRNAFQYFSWVFESRRWETSVTLSLGSIRKGGSLAVVSAFESRRK